MSVWLWGLRFHLRVQYRTLFIGLKCKLGGLEALAPYSSLQQFKTNVFIHMCSQKDPDTSGSDKFPRLTRLRYVCVCVCVYLGNPIWGGVV